MLADGLGIAAEAEPDLIVDIATLTGAAKVALGPTVGATFGNDDEAIAIAEEGLRLTAGFGTLHRAFASALAHNGRLEEARTAVNKVLELVPGESIAFGRQRSGYSDTPGTRRYFDGLRLAGMPEGDT